MIIRQKKTHKDYLNTNMSHNQKKNKNTATSKFDRFCDPFKKGIWGRVKIPLKNVPNEVRPHFSIHNRV